MREPWPWECRGLLGSGHICRPLRLLGNKVQGWRDSISQTKTKTSHGLTRVSRSIDFFINIDLPYCETHLHVVTVIYIYIYMYMYIYTHKPFTNKKIYYVHKSNNKQRFLGYAPSDLPVLLLYHGISVIHNVD